ncbi:MAG: TorF family putative porin [Planctomycetota bacterium]
MSHQGKLVGLCLTGGLAAATAAPISAQDAPPAVNNGLLTWSAGIDAVSTYVFRGFEQEDSGLILQPYVEVGVPIGDTGVDFYLGTWNSIHSEGTGASGSGPDNWYESDLYAGVSYSINDEIAVGALFTGFYYPNGSAENIEEIGFDVSYDDSALLGDYAFSPYLFIAFETKDRGGTEDIYAEIGGEFSAFFIESEDIPVSLSFPFALGFSIDDYYGDEDWGFLMVGVAAGMPLDFIPSDYGTWSASAGLDLFFVNDDAGLLDDGDDFEIVGKVGVGLEY